MADRPTIVLVGTLDTKGHEYGYLRERIEAGGAATVLIDVGVLGEPQVPADIAREDVAVAAGADHAELARAGDRGNAMTVMGRGAAAVVERLYGDGQLQGVVSIGGSGNASVAAAAMRGLPVGVPKLIVSTLAAGDTRPYVGDSDVTMMYSVVDIAGINQISARILVNAAGAITGMASAPGVGGYGFREKRPLIAATMFGVTTPCVTHARERLEELGCEVIVFHATGTGGRSMEALARARYFAGVLDATTTELADELVGGVLSAGPDRLEAVGAAGIPQVVSLGALDMVNFGPRESVPERFAGRILHVHNPTVTLMRTTPEENAELGRRIAAKLNGAGSSTVLFIPLGGVSAIDVESQPFRDLAADEALFDALRSALDPERVEVHEREEDINDPALRPCDGRSTARADRDGRMTAWRRRGWDMRSRWR